MTIWTVSVRSKDNVIKNKDLKGKLEKTYKRRRMKITDREEFVTHIILPLKFKGQTIKSLVTLLRRTKITNEPEKSNTK